MNEFVRHIPWDTEVFGRNILEIDEQIEVTPDEFKQIEQEYVDKYNPFMVFTKINATDFPKIHFFEDAGFRYIETQIDLTKKLDHEYKLDIPVRLSIAEEKDMPAILDIAKTTFKIDRYSIDPDFDGSVSGKRYYNWMKNIFGKEKTFLCKFELDGEIIGFTCFEDKGETANHMIMGLKNDLTGRGIGINMDMCLINFMKNMGYNIMDTHISVVNRGIFNIYTRLGYKLYRIMVVLRKIYK